MDLTSSARGLFFGIPVYSTARGVRVEVGQVREDLGLWGLPHGGIRIQGLWRFRV